MKNIFKLAAMAFAAITLFASCDNKEETQEPLSIDGQQYTGAWTAMGVDCVMDFGATTPGTFYLAYDGTEMGIAGFLSYITGAYTISATDETSGVVTITVEGQQAEIKYSNLDKDSASFTFEVAMIENVEFSLVSAKKALFDGMTGEPIQ